MSTILSRALILYFALIVSIRVMGKRQLGELSASELAITILIADLVAFPIQSNDIPLLDGIIPVIALACAEIILSTLSLKVRGIRRLLSGSACIVIKDGELNVSEMKRLRLNIDDLFEELRLQQVYSLSDISLAIFEPTGKLSVFQIPSAQSTSKKYPDFPVIVDGKLEKGFLDVTKNSPEFIYNILAEQNLKMKDIFLMTIDCNNQISITKKNQLKGILQR